MNVTPNIHWLKVPFSNIFTSVFLICTDQGAVLFDTASKASDVDQHILPWFEQLGKKPDYVFISHNHGDHSGGLQRVTELCPEIKIISSNGQIQEQYGERVLQPEDGQILLQVLQVVFIPGHTLDAMALLDQRTGTLLSGDCLQAYGVFGAGPWGSAIRQIKPHLDALKKLEQMELKQLVTAHDYHPYEAQVQNIPGYLATCKEALLRIKGMMLAHPGLDDASYVALYNDGSLPRIDDRVIVGMRIAIEQNHI